MSITHYAVADVIVNNCRVPFGSDAVMDYDVLSLSYTVLRLSKAYKVELGLALAQGILESHFACAPKAGRSRRTHNIYNVGNVDDGSDRHFPSYEAGIERYFQLMDKEYRWPQDKDGEVRMITLVANDFCRPRGGRYATASGYTQAVYAVYRKIMKELYPQGEPPPPQPTNPDDRLAA